MWLKLYYLHKSYYTGASKTIDIFLAHLPERDTINPCNPSPCGTNAICKQKSGAGSCTCLLDYIGNPYEGCRPECIQNSECPSNKACIRNKCIDPCPGTCTQNAICQIINHVSTCTCIPGYTGDPYRNCIVFIQERKNRKKLIFYLINYYIPY